MNTFLDIPLLELIQKTLAEQRYQSPTPIQKQTIPSALKGQDILGCAQTGTGKTAAFALPLLHHLGSRSRKSQPNKPLALVLAPTRELAIQIGDSFATYGRGLRLRQANIYGGVGQLQQIRALNRGVHILVATPGRLLDLMNQGHISLENLKHFVLDEADRMLDMGFLPDLKRIISQLPAKRQSLFFSATLSPQIIKLTDQLLQDPLHVNVTPKTVSVKRIQQRLLFVSPKDKQSVLRQILADREIERVLVFTKTKRGANKLVDQLQGSGIEATAIHGNKSQGARQKALEGFRRGVVRVLIATDVAARGIDVDGVSHVINYDLPSEAENYVHRIGRTGRAGANGIAISFCTSDDRKLLRAIETLIEQRIPVDPNFTGSGAALGKSRPSEQQPPKKSKRRRPRSGVVPKSTSPVRDAQSTKAKRKAASKRRKSKAKQVHRDN